MRPLRSHGRCSSSAHRHPRPISVRFPGCAYRASYVPPTRLHQSTAQGFADTGQVRLPRLGPVGTFEETLVHKIAFQLWRVDRLIRHETGIVSSKISNPEVGFDEADKSAIREVITKSQTGTPAVRLVSALNH